MTLAPKNRFAKIGIWCVRALFLAVIAYGIDRLGLNIFLAVLMFLVFELLVMYVDSTWFKK